MERVERRHGNVNMHDVIENAMRDLVERQTPAGFQQQLSGARLSEVCRQVPGLLFDGSRAQWYSGSNGSVQLNVGVVRNITKKPLRFDESNCASRRTMAVAVWPGSTLAPGQSAEVYMALNPNRVLTESRESLINH